jgi:hypothetical protein
MKDDAMTIRAKYVGAVPFVRKVRPEVCAQGARCGAHRTISGTCVY